MMAEKCKVCMLIGTTYYTYIIIINIWIKPYDQIIKS